MRIPSGMHMKIPRLKWIWTSKKWPFGPLLDTRPFDYVKFVACKTEADAKAAPRAQLSTWLQIRGLKKNLKTQKLFTPNTDSTFLASMFGCLHYAHFCTERYGVSKNKELA
jgi:hypothetical protein